MGASTSRPEQDMASEDIFSPSPSSSASPTASLSPFSTSPRSTPDSTPPSSSGRDKVGKSTMSVNGALTRANNKISMIKEARSENELCRLTASQALIKIRNDEISIEDWVTSLLSRIDDRDDLVGAWAFLDKERVISEAQRLDKIPKEQRGMLHGVPIGVKDVIYTKDMPTQHNSPLYDGSFPQVDAASICMLREAGCLIFGKTTTTEFAASFHGPITYNPHSLAPLPARTPGGSSSGSGASVGDFQIPIALATQTGGSTIRPASYNGIYALKPTWGAISREGQKQYSISLDTLGIYARGVEDLEMMAEGFGLWDDEMDPTLQDRPLLSEDNEEPVNEEDQSAITFPVGIDESVRGKKFAVCKSMYWAYAGSGTRAALEKATELLRSHGAIIEEIELPMAFNSLPEWYRITLYAEGRQAFYPAYVQATNAQGYKQKQGIKEQMSRGASGPRGGGLKSELLHESLVAHVENSYGFTKRQQLEAYDGIARLRPWMDEILSKYAALLTPSVVDEAPLGIDNTGSALFCQNWTTLHMPVVNIPGFQGENNMPIGVSLVAGRYRDRHLLRVAKAVGPIFEKEGGWVRNV